MKRLEPLNREQGMQYALRLLNQRNYSEFSLAQKLRLRHVPEADITAILDRLRELNLLNDQRYAESLVRTESIYRHASPRMVQQKLRQKGIAPEIIAGVIKVDNESIPDEKERARYHAARYREKNEVSDFTRKQKLAGYLYRKGFSSSVIRELLGEIE